MFTREGSQEHNGFPQTWFISDGWHHESYIADDLYYLSQQFEGCLGYTRTKNPSLFDVSWQSDPCVDAPGTKRRMNYVLVVRRQDNNRLLILLGDANVTLVSLESRDGRMSGCK